MPIKFSELVRKLRAAGFSGPYAGGKHPYMSKGAHKVTIPNPHEADISEDLLRRILRQAGITKKDWDQL